MTKLTLSIDKTVREAAKRYAKRSNTTVSRLVEDYLIRLMTSEETTYPSAVAELIGYAKTPSPPDDDRQAKLAYLKSKYLD
ncbi:MAG: DUF6364 family protein [Saprospiraceae bacterium]|nr:DUF6364 family protein [Saprospiraceae bacterium]